MEFLSHLWITYLYQPLLNLLIHYYNNSAHENLGVAVIYLTLTIRLILLPFSIVSERSKMRYEKMQEKVTAIRRDFKNDPVAAKAHIREALKKFRFSPWAKIVVIGVQVIALVVLYQVFIRGITGSKLNLLYPMVDRPEIIYTKFLFWDIGARNAGWAAAVAVILFFDIYFGLRRKKPVKAGDVAYMVIFPVGSFLVLWALPMVKSMFILTSLAVSYILGAFQWVFFRPRKGH